MPDNARDFGLGHGTTPPYAFADSFPPPWYPQFARLAERLGVAPDDNAEGAFVLDITGGGKYSIDQLLHAVLDRLDAAVKE